MHERRSANVRRSSGEQRRWSDDPEILAAFERVMLQLGRNICELRELAGGWSIEAAARVAGIDAGTIGDIEALRTDPQLSSLVRVAFALGRRVEIRFVR